jgi:hypothetical protein
MKKELTMKFRAEITITSLFSAFCLLPSAFGQGSLTPPGAPAPTMKSLDQIEPRTPISSAPFIIAAPGSYYLATNVTVSSGDAITVTANNVTLDLNGFSISSTAATATVDKAILFSGSHTNIAIYNGHISSGVTNNAGVYSGSGFAYGIISSGFPYNVRVSSLSVSGCLYDGISLGYNSTAVESCVVNTVGGNGIQAQTVSDSTALNCGSDGVSARTASNCYGSAATTGVGNGVTAVVANNCYGFSTGNYSGVSASAANNCYGSSSNPGAGDGVSANAANNCYGISSGSGTGVYAGIAINCYGTTVSGFGVDATMANNSYGVSSGAGIGLRCLSGVATGCYGYSNGYVGLNAYIANGSVGGGFTPLSVSYKFNMP